VIETEQSVLVDAPIQGVWDYVRDISRWANLMPGKQECAIIDDNDSRWTLKVGVGGLVRTVNVLVHVEQWDGPERVFFTYKLEGDPVKGGGSYTAASLGPNATEVALQIQVEGTGPMAPMWEAMGRPLLPQFAKAFAGQLKAEIEKALGTRSPAAELAAQPARSTLFASIRNSLQTLWRAIFGNRAATRNDTEERKS
jgi:carbon monoxide dehydrogenase subunit G